MASVSCRKEGQWLVRIRKVGFPQQIKTFSTKEQAEVWINDTEGKMNRGGFIDKTLLNQTKVFELLDRYEREITPTKKGEIKERSKIKILKKSYLAQASIGNVYPVDIVEYRKERSKEVGPATVAKEMNLLSHLFNVARSEWGYRGLDNPVRGVKRPRQPKGRERRLESVEEMDRIIAATGSPMLKVIIPLAVETAMRREEMVNIERRHIDFVRRTISLFDTKNGESRVVPLSTRAIEILRGYKPEEGGDYMFPMRPNSVTQAFKRATIRARINYLNECREAGKHPDKEFLIGLRLHDLRHEATSRFFERTNLREFEIMAITGHKDTRQLKRYTHLRATDLAKRLG